MLEKNEKTKWFALLLAIFIVLLTLTSRICLAYFCPVDSPGDGVIYTQLAKNLLEQNVYSIETQAPFTPTLIRLPGYPLFVAAVYSIFGHENNTAVRIVQAVFDTVTCVIAALLAFIWTEDEERKKRNALCTLLLAGVCPFIAIYAATLLTETLTTFLMAAMALTATFALKALSIKRSISWWIFTGVLSGMAVLLRPDSGLFAAGIGLTLVISGLFLQTDKSPAFRSRLWQVFWNGTVFSVFFVLVLTPWTIRNYKVFGVFQPISPAHAEMPGEFVPYGYQRWLRTWVDDFRFIEPTQWNLGEKPIRIAKIPRREFDSIEERDRVAALFDQYNNPPGSEGQYTRPAAIDEMSVDDMASNDETSEESAENAPDPNEDQTGDQADANSNDSSDEASDDDDENKRYQVKMTPEIDAQFSQIADERIARSKLRYYLFLPAKRAAAFWFDSHSLYYPFGGQMSPISDLDYDVDQQYWLPAFTVMMWIDTLLAFGGALFLWRNRSDRKLLRWLILIALMTLPRIIFFSTVENPEPRYVVELFIFTAILGGIFLGSIKLKKTEIDEPLPADMPADRLMSLDVFRGITIAAMVLVNEPGSWTSIYPQLAHADWHGATFTDLIFPFFLFIVGVSTAFALGKRKDEGRSGREVHFKIVKRSILLFSLGLFLEIFPFYNIWTAAWFEPSNVRIMGVLQRIAICYLAAAVVFLHTSWKRQAVIAAAILFVYWALMMLVKVPGCEITTINDKACNLATYVDRAILGTAHIWNQSPGPDPEGLITTLPAIVTTLFGVLAGTWLRSPRESLQKVGGMLIAGVVLAASGWILSFWIPFNKSLWTSSYAVYTAGLALCFLAFCYWLVDLKGYRKWSLPFLVFGTNAIALYVGATIMGRTLYLIELVGPKDQTISLREKIFDTVFLPNAEPVNASLLFAVSFLLVWLVLIGVMYRKKIFLKI